MPFVRGGNAELLAPGLNMRTFTAYREKPEIYRLLTNVKSSNSAFEDDWAISGFGPLGPKTELGTTLMDEPVKLGGTRIWMFGYALGFIVSEEMQDDIKYPVIADLASALGRSSRYTAEVYAHDPWNDAFAGAKYLCRDGQPLCSTLHPIVGTGGVAANKPAVDTDISLTAFDAAYANFATQVDDLGMPIELSPVNLWVHPTQLTAAKQILQSPGIPTALHAGIVNVLQGWVQPQASVHFTDTDAWFLTAAPNEVGVEFYWRKTPDTKTWDDEDVDGTIHKIKQRHGQGTRDWRGVYGSSGGA